MADDEEADPNSQEWDYNSGSDDPDALVNDVVLVEVSPPRKKAKKTALAVEVNRDEPPDPLRLALENAKNAMEMQRILKNLEVEMQERVQSSRIPYAVDAWDTLDNNAITQQVYTIHSQETGAYISDKEPLSKLAAEYELGCSIFIKKIKVLREQYIELRRSRGDGNYFFRSFMFSYLEHILESQDHSEVDRIRGNIEECRQTLNGLGYDNFTFEDYFEEFLELLEDVFQGTEPSISHDDLMRRCCDQSISDSVVMFLRFVTAGEMQKRAEFYKPFIMGISNLSVDQFCKNFVLPMCEESDNVHITALSNTLGVPIRVVHLDRSDTDSSLVNHHDFIPAAPNSSGAFSSIKPNIILLYRPGHYDILYPK